MGAESYPFTMECVRGSMPWCECDCPLNFDIRGFLGRIETGSFSGAYKMMLNSMIFPAVTTRICEAYCAKHCRGNIHILDLEKYCLSKIAAAKRGAPAYSIPAKPYHVAVIGAGIGGLTCAQRLAAKRYQVTVFEQQDCIGGTLCDLMDRGIFEEEFALQFKHAPYTLVTGRKISTLDDLDFDAVYIATGRGGEDYGLLDGWDNQCMATRRDGVFLGGELTGANKMESLSHGKIASISIEKYVQVKRMDGQPSSFHINDCVLPDIESQPVGTAPVSELYTREEAVAEAKRCLMCNCDLCMKQCEYLSEIKTAGRDLDAKCLKCVGAIDLSVHTGIRDILSCDVCGHCNAVCPHGVDIQGMMVKYKQDVDRIKKIAPFVYDYFRREMDRAMNEDYFLLLPEKGSAKYLLFPGCAVSQSSPEYVIKSMEYLRQYTPDTGLLLGCCGIPALWAGETQRMEAAQEKLRSDWVQAGKPIIVTMCQSCERIFTKYLSEIPCISVFELMDQFGLPKPTSPCGSFAVFDPCSSREFPTAQAAVRSLAQKSGAALSELPDHGETARCCGMSGHVYAANQSLAKKTTARAAALSGEPYLVYCANCQSTFLAAGKPCVHVLDLVFGLTPKDCNPHIAEKQKNRARLKQYFLTNVWETDAKDPSDLIFEPALLDKLDRLLISQDEIAQVIRHCEQQGSRAYDAESGHYTAHLRLGVMTYWAEYTVNQETILVKNAYKHKMEILGMVL